MEDGSPPSDMRVDEAQPQEAEIVAIRLATSRRNIPDQSESLASSVDTSPAKSVAPTSSSSPSAHVHSTPTGRFAWLTCPDDVLVDFCTTADAKVDALLAAAERGLVAAVSAYTATRATPPVELGACLLRAAAMGRLSVAEELLREGSLCPVESADATGATPAHRAADGNHAALLELLVARGGVGCLLARDAVGRTPLHAAVSACAMDAVATLVRAGASGAATDDRGRTPLDLARTRLDVALADDRDSSGKKAARWRRIVSALGGDELQQRHADERVRGRVADAQGVAEEDGDESGLPGASGADLSAYVAAAAAASLPAAPSSAAPADLPTLLVMLLAKLKASVDQVRVSTHPPLQILVLRATCVPPARPRCTQGIFGGYADIYALFVGSDGECAAEDISSGCAEMGITGEVGSTGVTGGDGIDGHHRNHRWGGQVQMPSTEGFTRAAPVHAVLPELLPSFMDRMTGRPGAASVSSEEFVAFWEHLSRSAEL